MPTFLHRCRRAGRGLLLALCAVLPLSPAWAEEAEEVVKLLQAGKPAEALRMADQRLARKPDDVQLRFLRGVALAEQNRSGEAMGVFNKLVLDHPELPEPYNNLAVLYANQGQFDKARTALETAIRTNPSYATAHENLGDLYAKMASQAYAKALQLDAGNGRAAPKLAMLRELVSLKGPQSPAASARAEAAEAAPAPAPAAPPAAPVPLPSQPAPVAAATPESPAASAAPAEPADDEARANAEVRRAIEAWARAWSRQDMAGYFAAYTPGYTADGLSRSAWEQSRRQRIEGKKSIRVDIEALSVQVQGSRATASFRQDYRADSLNISTRKQLRLVRQGGGWRIDRESTGR